MLSNLQRVHRKLKQSLRKEIELVVMQQPHIVGYSSDYCKGEQIGAHRHDEHQIVHARSGVMRVESGPSIWVIPPGRALWVPVGVEHGIYCLTNVKTRTVYISDSWSIQSEQCEVWQLTDLMREVIIRFADEPDTRLTEPLFEILKAEVERLDTTPMNFVKVSSLQLLKIQDQLIRHPADNRTLADWADEIGLAPRTLMRRLFKETGQTFREWRRQIRMLKATELLAADVPVTTVGYEVGYENTSAFIDAFHRTMGSTPAQYFQTDSSEPEGRNCKE